MDTLQHQTRISSTRLDVHRHRLDDKRMDYAWMNANLPRERQHRLGAHLRLLRLSLAAMLTRNGRAAHLQSSEERADTTVTA